MISKEAILLMGIIAVTQVEKPYSQWVGIYPCTSSTNFVLNMACGILIMLGMFELFYKITIMLCKRFKIEFKKITENEEVKYPGIDHWLRLAGVQRTSLLVAIFMTPIFVRWARINICYDHTSTIKVAINDFMLTLGLSQVISLNTYWLLKPFRKRTPG